MLTDKEQVVLLRSALAGLLGAGSKRELLELLDAVNKCPDVEENKTLACAAISAMLATIPDA